jgi:hypothetical protein
MLKVTNKGKKNIPIKDKNDYCNDDAVEFKFSPGYVKSVSEIFKSQAMKVLWDAALSLGFAELTNSIFIEVLGKMILDTVDYPLRYIAMVQKHPWLAVFYKYV